jgi:hypothetical protein
MRRVVLLFPLVIALSCRTPSRPTGTTSLVGLTWRAQLLPRVGMETRIIGQLRITPGPRANTSHVVIEVEGGARSNLHPWVIKSGACDAIGSMELGGRAMYPVIELGFDGRGKVTKDLAIKIPLDQRYHVEIYAGRAPGAGNVTNRDLVVSCGELAAVTS